MEEKIRWSPVPHSYCQAFTSGVECTMYVLDMRTGITLERTVWLRYRVDLPVLLDHCNNTDRYHKYSSQHTLA